MAQQSIMKAQNTFGAGLVMDFIDTLEQPLMLTNALNATFMTFNGNERALQNDMGNGRVETAYLPEGYVPVGTCEFGGIIYVVSYNPLQNKSQIGCFPSPERNISSDETTDTEQVLKKSDFQSTNGKLIRTSVKKILYGTRTMNPGDKYIIYTSDNIEDNKNQLSDFGNNSFEHGRFPKYLKIHVVSIEDSGKIVYLDSTTKWYNNSYYILKQASNSTNAKADIDSYRTLVSSAYSVFQSKVSGKLALLVELEKITSFNCSYSVYPNAITIKGDGNDSDVIFKPYDVYFNIGWTSDNNNINPSHIVLTESEWNDGTYYKWESLDSNNKSILLNKNLPKSIISFKTNTPEAYSLDATKYYNQKISRLYTPEAYTYNTYFEFLSNQFDVLVENTLDNIYNTVSGNKLPYKLNGKPVPLRKLTYAKYDNYEDLNAGHPILVTNTNSGKYYVNLTNYIIDNNTYHYYTTNNNELIEIPSFNISDDIVNNYFKKSVYKKFNTFYIPVKLIINNLDKSIDTSGLIYRYKIAPAMPYGILDELAIDGYIDFSKIGNGTIDLTNWRYFIQENLAIISLGLDAYCEPNKGISEVVVEFYDDKGIAAAYHISDKASYSGIFTEYIPLNGTTVKASLNNTDSQGNEIVHPGNLIPYDELNQYDTASLLLSDGTYKIVKRVDSTNWTYDGATSLISQNNESVKNNFYFNDSGTLNSNKLYLTKITVKYCNYNVMDEFDETDTSSFKYFYRWFWTTTQFNDYYYNTKDFKDLQFKLGLDAVVHYNSTSSYKYVEDFTTYANTEIAETDTDVTNMLAATLFSINKNNSDKNVITRLEAGLLENYNTFNLDNSALNLIKVTVTLGKSNHSLSVPLPVIKHSSDTGAVDHPCINPIIDSTEKLGIIAVPDVDDSNGGANFKKNYANYKNKASIMFGDTSATKVDNFSYIGNDNITAITLNPKTEGEENTYSSDAYVQKTYNLNDILWDGNTTNSKGIPLKLQAIVYCKYYQTVGIDKFEGTTLASCAYNKEDLEDLGIIYDNGNFHINKCGYITYFHSSSGGRSGNNLRMGMKSYKSSTDNYNKTRAGVEEIFSENWESDTTFRHYSNIPGYPDSTHNHPRTSNFDKISVWTWWYYNDADLPTDNLNKWDANGFYKTLDPYNKVSLRISENNSLSWLGVKDTDGNIHFINTFFKNNDVLGVNTGNTKAITVGDAVVSVLANLFRQTLDASKEFPIIKDTATLLDHTYDFCKDIIYDLFIDNSNSGQKNNLIKLGNINYGTYVNKLITTRTTLQSVYTSAEGTSITNEDANINVEISSTRKNFALLLQFPYDITNVYTVESTYNTAYLDPEDPSKVHLLNLTVDPTKLYYFDYTTGKFNTIGSKFSFKYIDSITPVSDTNKDTFLYKFKPTPVSNPYLKNVFSTPDLTIVDTNPGDTSDSWDILCNPTGTYMGKVYIKGNKKSEVLVTMGQLYKV